LVLAPVALLVRVSEAPEELAVTGELLSPLKADARPEATVEVVLPWP